ncbi:MAG: PqqD family protein [Prevotella sp.]|nr:PqqD family protein [Prevotella sp.]
MRIKKGFVLREVCGEQVIVGEGLGAIDFGKLLSLNDSAAWLWKQASEMDTFDVETLTDRLCEEYDVSKEDARRDVSEIILEWQRIGVVELS